MKIQKTRSASSFALEFAAFCVISALISLIFIIFMLGTNAPKSTEKTSSDGLPTVIIDAGHGGEDGGCEGYGLVEKDLNLDISLRLASLLRSEGISVVLTRETDVLLYDREEDYEGRKKVLDLRKRLEIGKSLEDAIFISVHMNYFPESKYSGLQVWYSKNDARSRILAHRIQSSVVSCIQTSNRRTVKEATSSIFLLDNLTCPAVLIECGFLSNPEEARSLGDENYRQALTEVIFRAVMEYISQNSS